MTKPDKPNFFSKIGTNLSWVSALIFPKKSKPTPKPSAAPVSAPPPALPPRPPATPPSTFSSPAPVVPPPVISQPPVAPRPVAPPPPVVTSASAASKPAEEKKPGLFSFQPRKLLPAFWTVASVLSFIVNLILIVTIIILGQELFELKRLIGNNVLGGLYENFVKMDEANIATTIQVVDTIPVSFNLPISQDTVVTLTEPTFISNVMINLSSGGLTINSPANITLPAGTNLPVHLELTVPVDTTIPITLNVPVDIPLNQTELHEPFVGLQGVIGPYHRMLDPNIKTASDVPICNDPMVSWFCQTFFVK